MIIWNKIIPLKGYIALSFYPFIFIRKEYKKSSNLNVIFNHEKIHFEQQKELYFIFFYIKYIYWWLKFGYKQNPFEKEAYSNEYNLNYIKQRDKYSYKKYY